MSSTTSASIQSKVAEHYNNVAQFSSLSERESSSILGVRRFNNWIKSVLIARYLSFPDSNSSAGKTVLDLCCGKGGDLKKFKVANIHRYVGCDHAYTSVVQAMERFNGHPNSTPTFFATFIVADLHRVRLSKLLQEQQLFYDLVSCQFALHYCFETEATARVFCQNIADQLKVGGYFVATFPSADALIKRTLQEQRLNWGNSIFSVKFKEPAPFAPHLKVVHQSNVHANVQNTAASEDCEEDFPPLYSPFGIQYSFDLLEAIDDCPEYLVHYPTLCALLAEYDLEPVTHCSLHDIFFQFSNVPQYHKLAQVMKLVDPTTTNTNKRRRGFQNNNEPDVERPPGITPEEWEVLHVYCAVVFRKRVPKSVSNSAASSNVSSSFSSSATNNVSSLELSAAFYPGAERPVVQHVSAPQATLPDWNAPPAFITIQNNSQSRSYHEKHSVPQKLTEKDIIKASPNV